MNKVIYKSKTNISKERIKKQYNCIKRNNFRCDHPMHILHQRGMLCRKTMKFIEQGSIDKLRKNRIQCASYVLREKTNFVLQKLCGFMFQ